MVEVFLVLTAGGASPAPTESKEEAKSEVEANSQTD
jgi:hypothetical protein